VCRHLLDAAAVDDGIDYLWLFTGNGMDHDVCCVECDPQAAPDRRPELLEVCEACVARVVDVNDLEGWRGEPQVLERPEQVTVTRKVTMLPDGLGPVTDLIPVGGAVSGPARSWWLLLTAHGDLARLDADSGEVVELARHTVPEEPDRTPWAGRLLRRHLHASPDGRFAAVVNDHGRYGQVIDLTTGSVALHLDGGDYHPETVPLSLAFIEHAGKTLVIHRTAWNRLDVSDPGTGELLTGRGPTAYRQGEERPLHYLDYFHGALLCSPGGQWLVDDGWVWSPVGMPSVWDLSRWLTANVWESEDGPSRRWLCQRRYYWNGPMCWIDANTLAISGLGDDDETMLPGLRVFDVATGVEVRAFAGPAGALFASRGRLYSVAGGAASVWDPATGERISVLDAVNPTSHNPWTGELASIEAGQLIRWDTPT
jgi:hypothetical protein